MSVVSGGKFCVMINDVLGTYFSTRKVLRQGDPFSPFLFDVAGNVLDVLWQRSQEKWVY
jgi:hypothetical protein